MRTKHYVESGGHMTKEELKEQMQQMKRGKVKQKKAKLAVKNGVSADKDETGDKQGHEGHKLKNDR